MYITKQAKIFTSMKAFVWSFYVLSQALASWPFDCDQNQMQIELALKGSQISSFLDCIIEFKTSFHFHMLENL